MFEFKLIDFCAWVLALVSTAVTAEWVVSKLILTPTTNLRLENALKNNKVAKYTDIPGPIGVPVVGALFRLLPYILRKRMDLHIMDSNIYYKGLCRYNIGYSYKVVCVDDAVIAKRLLSSSDFARGPVLIDALRDILPFALFALPSGELWKKHSKGVQPAFGPAHLVEVFSVSSESVDRLLDFWDSRIALGENTRNVMHDFTMLTGDVIAKVGFSVSLGAVESLQSNQELEFHNHMKKIYAAAQARIGLRNNTVLWELFGLNSKYLEPSQVYLKDMLESAMCNKKRESKMNGEGRDLLDRILNSNILTDEEIQSELLGFFFAGHESTSNTLTWAMYELVKNPGVYRNLQSEIDTELNGSEPTSEDLKKLKYLDAFVKETQRFHTVVTTLSRETYKETTLTTQDGLTIVFPPKITFLINIPRIHTFERYWGEDAKRFNPSRWKEDFVPAPGTYLPFGDGPMNCIGQKMAMIEIKITLIKIIQRYEIKLAENQDKIEPVTTITHGLKDGLVLAISKRA
ncbi:hypothetical protein HK098_002249 [Nowakowskiella sp. JEL0407]|nr:hypothetical protein HK098_002249 [Nowakowskiella sp. JEL0407]